MTAERSLYALRGYGLGERNPATLPDGTKDSESWSTNEARTKFWRSLRKKVQAGSKIRIR